MWFLLNGFRGAVVTGSVLLVACEEQERPPAPQPVPAVPASRPSASEEPEVVPLWFEGQWLGEAQLTSSPDSLTLDKALREGTATKESTEAAVSVQLDLTIARDHQVTGQAKIDGHASLVGGVLDEEILRLTVRGAKAQGTLIAGRTGGDSGESFEGTLRASLTANEEGQAHAQLVEGAIELRRGP